MSILVRAALFAAGALLIPTAAFASWQEEDAKARVMYGRADIPLVSEIRSFTHGKPNSGVLFRGGIDEPSVTYEPDQPRTDIENPGREGPSYSQILHDMFARIVRHSGLMPISATGSDRQTEILLWCRGSTRIDRLYGNRAARLVIGPKKVTIAATRRESIAYSDPLNHPVGSRQTEIAATKVDEMVAPKLWGNFFESGPAIYDATQYDTALRIFQSGCVIEAYRGEKYTFLWRANYHNDVAAAVIGGLWALVNVALPGKPVPQFFPSPLFFPRDNIRTPAGTYRLSDSEKIAWHNVWDALFTQRLSYVNEAPLYGTTPQTAVFRHLDAGASGNDYLVTLTFDGAGTAKARLKSEESKRCTPDETSISVDYVIREFRVPAGFDTRIYGLLASKEFKEAAGDQQTDGFDGADYLYEFATPDGSYIARKRWSPDDGIFAQINGLISKIIESPAAQADSAVVSRKRLQNCPDQPAKR